MSDTTSVLGALGVLATGGSVRLGPITFAGFEVPARINFGGSQQLVVHKLPGGARVIDSLGDDPATPQWKGCFTGPLAASRARQVNALRVAAAPVALGFGPFTAQVVIRRFEASYERNGFWIPYRITCEVIPPDQDSGGGAGGAVLAQDIASDGADALAALSQAGAQAAGVADTPAVQASAALARLTPPGTAAMLDLDGVTAALASGLDIVAGVPNLAQSPGAASQAAAQLQSAADGIASALAVAGVGLGQIGATAVAAGSTDPAASINDLVNATALAGAVAALAQAGGYAGRAASSAAGATISMGERGMTTTVTVSNTTLFAVAATYLGDATQWVRIAQANGLVDSTVAGTVTLVLPPPDPAASGGIISIGALATLPVTTISVVVMGR